MDAMIRALGPADAAAVVGASRLFDGPAHEDATRAFLADPRHHMLFAFVEDRPVGFVSGVELIHPDKGTEMLLYELAVDESERRRGIGRALIEALAAVASERRCYGMFVLVDDDNEAALATYASAGGTVGPRPLMLDFHVRR